MPTHSEDDCVTVVGAGLAGCMAALLLAQQRPQQRVCVVESRSDPRRFRSQSSAENGVFGQLTDVAKRSINLALSHRGVESLKAVGIYKDIQDLLIPMKGRYIHNTDGSVSIQPYGQSHEAIHSVGRGDLNNRLIAELDALPNVELVFDTKIASLQRNGDLAIQGQSEPHRSKYVIGADGSFSKVRTGMRRHGRFNFEQKFVECGYRELTIPPDANGDFAMPANYLHIWPRGEYMLIGLPNPDKTFTCTLFAPWKGPNCIDVCKSEAEVEAYFSEHFADAVPLMPNLRKEYFQNPASALPAITMSPWNMNDKCVLIGDAAHAIVPFYGQGMNCAFEDALYLSECLQACGPDSIGEAFELFSTTRQPAACALRDLSEQNRIEMSSLTGKPWFLWKKKLEGVLNYLFPSLWKPIYSMVTFTRIPYDQASRRAKKQDTILALAAGGLLVGASAFLASKLHRANHSGHGGAAGRSLEISLPWWLTLRSNSPPESSATPAVVVAAGSQ